MTLARPALGDRGAIAISIALHAGIVAVALLVPAAPPRRAAPVKVEIVETVRPPPPAPPARPEPEPEPERAPEPPAPPPRVVRAPVKVPRDAAPRSTARPPPSAPAPSPAPEAPPEVGITMSGGTTGVAVPQGNTLHGEVPRRAPASAPAPYPAEGTAPGAGVTELPEVIDASVPPREYPPQARREGKEGVVQLRLVVGTDGRVTEARVVSDPGYGFGEAAVRVAKRYYRFRPARVGKEPVATEIPFTVRFELP